MPHWTDKIVIKFFILHVCCLLYSLYSTLQAVFPYDAPTMVPTITARVGGLFVFSKDTPWHGDGEASSPLSLAGGMNTSQHLTPPLWFGIIIPQRIYLAWMLPVVLFHCDSEPSQAFPSLSLVGGLWPEPQGADGDRDSRDTWSTIHSRHSPSDKRPTSVYKEQIGLFLLLLFKQIISL